VRPQGEKKKKRGRRADRRCGEAPQLARLPIFFLCLSYLFPMSFLGSRLFVSLELVPFLLAQYLLQRSAPGMMGSGWAHHVCAIRWPRVSRGRRRMGLAVQFWWLVSTFSAAIRTLKSFFKLSSCVMTHYLPHPLGHFSHSSPSFPFSNLIHAIPRIPSIHPAPFASRYSFNHTHLAFVTTYIRNQNLWPATTDGQRSARYPSCRGMLLHARS